MAKGYIDMGLYTITEASRLIGVPHMRLRRWVCGDPHGGAAPLIANQIARVDGQIVLSFVNLIEALFISKFAGFGLHIRSIRAMAEEAQRVLESPHPFATNILFKTDGKAIFAQTYKQTGDKALYNLKKHNWAFEPIVSRGLKAAVVYTPKGYAQQWYPRKKASPHIVVNPVSSFGQPVLSDYGVPTSALLDAYRAEEKRADLVAKWFDVPEARVIEAVRFESALSRAA